MGVKQDASYFEDKEPVLIYIGKKLKDALRLEEIFTAANVALTFLERAGSPGCERCLLELMVPVRR